MPLPDIAPYLPYVVVFIVCSLAVLAIEIAAMRIHARNWRERAVNRRLQKSAPSKSPETLLLELRKERGLDEFGNFRYFSNRLNRLYVQSGYTSRPAWLFVPGIFTALAPCLAISLATGSILMPAIVGGGFFLVMPLLILVRKRAKRQKEFAAQLPDALDVIVRSLRAGHPTPVAIGLVAREMPDPIGTEFGIVSDEMTYGKPLPEAVKGLVDRVGLDDLRLLVIAISIQFTTGGNLSDILSNLSNTIRGRALLRARVKALSAEGRMSAIVLSLFPFALFAIINFMSPDYYWSVMHEPVVYYGFAGAIVLMLIGDYIMYRMITFEV